MSKNKDTDHPIFSAQSDPRKYDVYLDLAKSKDNWRKAFFIAALCLLLVSGAFIVRSFQAKFKPYIVKVNDLGTPVNFGPAQPLKQNDERLLRAQLYQWIVNIRSIYGDKYVLHRQMKKAFSLVSGDVSKQLNQYFSVPSNDPRNLMDRWRRQVEVRSIIPIDKKEGHWQIKWEETMLSLRGTPTTRQEWQAFITIKNVPPTTSTAIVNNPLGIYITQLSWSSISPTKTP